MALLAAGADAAVRRPTERSWRVAATAAVAGAAFVVVAVNAQHSREEIWSRTPAGVWTPPLRYRAMDAVRALPAGVAVFANQPSAVYALSGRPLAALPLQRSPMTGAPNPDTGRDLDELAALLAADRAVVVIDRPTAWILSGAGQPLVTEEQLRARVPLTTLAEDERFVVLG
jgi:hypothetical protein